MFGEVVVGIDGRAGGRDAIALAAVLAPRARLTLVRAFTYGTGELLAEVTGWDDSVRTSTLESLARERDRAGIEAELEAAPDGSPAHLLHEVATRRGADLLVLGSAHHGRFGRVLLGDVGRAVMHEAPCPVAVAPRADAGAPLRTVAVGLDGTPEAQAALAVAMTIARERDARLRVLVVVHEKLVLTPAYPVSYDWEAHAARQRALARKIVDAALETAGPDTEAAVLEGLPSVELVQATHDADLMVVGSRGWGPARRVLLGSTSDALTHRAACPVLVVPRG